MGLFDWIRRIKRARQRRRLVSPSLSPDVMRLSQGLKSGDWQVQVQAFEEMAKLRDKTAEVLLIRAVEGATYQHLSKASPYTYFMVVSRAAAALARLDTDEGFQALEDNLKESAGWDEPRTSAMIYGFGFSPRPHARELILSCKKTVGGQFEDVKKEALERLAENG